MNEPRNADNWAKPVDEFRMGEIPEGAVTGNVEGRKLRWGPISAS